MMQIKQYDERKGGEKISCFVIISVRTGQRKRDNSCYFKILVEFVIKLTR